MANRKERLDTSHSHEDQHPAAKVPAGTARRAERVWLVLLLAAGLADARIAPAQVATISVRPELLGKQIPKDFVGLSLEVSMAGGDLAPVPNGAPTVPSPRPDAKVQYALGRLEAPNEVFFQFMRNLGPSVLRLGGSSQDNTCWDPANAPHPNWCQGSLTARDFKLFSKAAEATGWRLLVGFNLEQNSGAWALREVTQALAQNMKQSQVLALEPGNEPDIYSSEKYRLESYSPRDHVKDFLGYAQAFRENPPARVYPLAGPATCCNWRNPADLELFLKGVEPLRLKLVTVHDYPTAVCEGQTTTLAQLLASALMTEFDERARPWAAVAQKQGLPIALAEANSTSCGGMPGVSDAMASALWGLEYMFSAAQDGFRYINIHMSYRPGGSSYNPVDTVGRQDTSHQWHYRNVANPLNYAMYMFATQAAGEHFLSANVETAANVRTFAMSACAGCEVRVFVINKDLTAAGPVRVHLSQRRGRGSLLLLSAPSLNSKAPEVQYGGARFDEDGHLPAPHTAAVEPDAQGNYTFDLPNASAALLTVAP